MTRSTDQRTDHRVVGEQSVGRAADEGRADETSPPNGSRRMRNISHTNPHTGESAGHAFLRGPPVAADGGERNAVPTVVDADADGVAGAVTDASADGCVDSALDADVDADTDADPGGSVDSDGGIDASEAGTRRTKGDDSEAGTRRTMAEIEHTAPSGTADVNLGFGRGSRGDHFSSVESRDGERDQFDRFQRQRGLDQDRRDGGTGADTGTNTDVDTGTDTGSNTESGTGTDTDIDTDTDTDTDARTDTAVGPGTATETEAGFGFDTNEGDI